MAKPTRLPSSRPQLTPELVAGVEEDLKNGVTRKRALLIAGLTTDDVRSIDQLAEYRVEPYATFVVAMHKAEAECEKQLIRTIHASKDWRAAESVLKRKFPEEWGDKVQLEVRTELERMFKLAEEVLPPEWYTKLVDAAARSGSTDSDPPAEHDSAVH